MKGIEQLKGHHKEEFIAKIKKTSTKLEFAVQLGTVRFLGCFTSDFEILPLVVIQYLASQLKTEY